MPAGVTVLSHTRCSPGWEWSLLGTGSARSSISTMGGGGR